ncbi:hypothetical protein NDN08_000407 [Rhodosorus marinus]|uniref:DUF1995 domain-containing protein n=1 Tax=Rhodosorus marinus TaxID=101924 RepID=A0AAV8UMU8_9RHOD|nr:hypothetical protein NDN08_000407 [Rhodosorus marinus]
MGFVFALGAQRWVPRKSWSDRSRFCETGQQTSQANYGSRVFMSGGEPEAPEADSSLNQDLYKFAIPMLYDGWFSQNGELAKQMQETAVAAVNGGSRTLEISFPPVPNVDEVKFGTKLNSMFGEDIARYFRIEDEKKVKRYMIEFANFYWASRLAEAFPDRKVWILCCNSVKKSDARIPPNVEVACALDRVERGKVPDDDALIIINDPGATENWRRGAKYGGKDRVVVMLNSAFVETYDLRGPLKEYEQSYFLKRISKGWVYKAEGQPWLAYLERPDGSVEILDVSEQRPRLGDVSKTLREESFRRYSIYNDRWSPGFGARL